MNIMCLMGLIPAEVEKSVEDNSKLGMQNAANRLQKLIVDGLSKQEGVYVSITNSMYIGSYPKKYREMKIPGFEFKHSESVEGVNVGFNNLTGYKWISRYFGCKKQIKKWCESEANEEKVLLVYALTTPFVNIASFVKKKYPDIEVFIVVPDLPEYMNTKMSNRKTLYHWAKACEIRMIRKCIKKVDGYVLLTEAMSKWFGYPVRYTVLEGIASGQENEDIDEKIDKKQTILYAGGIKREYGVCDLVEAFIEVDEKGWDLLIYGDGCDMNDLRKIAQGHDNVHLCGRAPNDLVVARQKESSVLVNPRRNHEFTKYSFPSKILEYMSSGTPVLAYKLNGVPDEYDEYYFRIYEREQGLQDALKEVMQMDSSERMVMGERAKEFVMMNKNSQAQCKKIVQLINGSFQWQNDDKEEKCSESKR